VNVQRSLRLASLLREEINTLLRKGVKDPRLDSASVTRVEVSADCRNARVLFTCLGDQSGAQDAQQAFARATGYFRSRLGRTLRLRRVPELLFVHDRVLHEATEVRLLIDEVIEDDRGAQRARGEFDEEPTGESAEEE